MKKNILQSLSYTFTSNIVNLITSLFLITIVPKYIGVESYSYWQLYIFYTTYLQYLTLGIPEGIYLKFGGSYYDQLPRKNLRNQYVNLLVFSLLFSVILGCFGLYDNMPDTNKSLILIFSAITVLLIVPRSVLTYELQATNELKIFSITMIQEKIVLIIGIIVLLYLKVLNFRIFILIDIFSKLITNIILIYICRHLIFGKMNHILKGFKDSFDFFKQGINITLSNISSILVTGIIRMSIELKWPILIFGKVSLVISMTNMIMVFINSISIVFFPILKRMKSNDMKSIFQYLDELLSKMLYNVLLIYFPIYIFLQSFLPDYVSSLKYLGIIFPMTIFESKIAVLYNTYLKALRMEKKLFQVNIVMVLLTLISIYPIVWIFELLDMALLMITLVSVFKSYFLEKFICKKLEINRVVSFPVDCFIVLLFVLSSTYLSLMLSLIVTVITISLYNLYVFKEVKNAWIKLTIIVKNFG